MPQLDTRLACLLGVVCLICIVIILFNGPDDGGDDPGAGWR